MVYLNDDIDSIDIASAIQRVGLQRADYALRYVHEHDKKLSLAVCLLLMEGLEKEYGITELPEFNYGYHGKPSLKGVPYIHFNLSHCYHAALCVINNQPVGCDVESVPEELDIDLCKFCFNKEEVALIMSATKPTLAFTSLWTRKEAFLKLTGMGLIDNLPALFNTPQTKNVVFNTYTAPDRTYIYTICKWKELVSTSKNKSYLV